MGGDGEGACRRASQVVRLPVSACPAQSRRRAVAHKSVRLRGAPRHGRATPAAIRPIHGRGGAPPDQSRRARTERGGDGVRIADRAVADEAEPAAPLRLFRVPPALPSVRALSARRSPPGHRCRRRRQRPRHAGRRSTAPRASHRRVRPPCASASRVDTGTIGLPSAIASPCIAAMPTRRPVNEPGPAATASRSTAFSADARAIHELDQLARQALAVRQRRIAGHLGEHDCDRRRWPRSRRAPWYRLRGQSSEESQWAQCYTRSDAPPARSFRQPVASQLLTPYRATVTARPNSRSRDSGAAATEPGVTSQ